MEDKNNNYPWQGMLIVTFLGLVGLALLLLTGAFTIANYEEFYEYLNDKGLAAIISIFFIFVSIYCWILYIRNVIIKPKQVTLYLMKQEGHTCKFMDESGKTFLFDSRDCIEGKFYYVLKTHDEIKQIIGLSGEVFERRKEKISYWLNFYSPIGNFENIFLLPIVYVIALPGVLSTLMSEGTDKIYGLIFSGFPIYVIIYDLIYKYKLSKSENGEVDAKILEKSYEIILASLKPLAAIYVCGMFTYFFILSDGPINKLIFSPFLLCAYCTLGMTLSATFNKDKLTNLFQKLYIVIFLLYWFGLIIYYIYKSIGEGTVLKSILITSPFTLVGLFVVYKYLIKGDKNDSKE